MTAASGATQREVQLGGNAARAVERILRVDRVDAMLERHLLRRRLTRPVVQTGPADPEHIRLRQERERRRLSFDERPALSTGKGRDQISF